MKTQEIILEIKKLPVHLRKVIIREVISSVREDEGNDELYKAAENMAAEYRTNKDLTAFSEIDLDDFNETG
jgi:hypothetical protein